MKNGIHTPLLIIIGNMATSFGNSMYVVALIIFASDKFNEPLYIGFIQTAAYLPVALFSLHGGRLADRSRRPLIIAGTDLARGIFLFSGAMLLSAFTGIQPFIILIPMVFFNSVMQAHFSPAVISFVLDQKRTKWDLLSLRTGSGHLASLAGQTLGALLYPFTGLIPLLLINSACFTASGISELFLKENQLRGNAEKTYVSRNKIDIFKTVKDFIDLDKKGPPVFLYLGMQAVNSMIVLNLPFFITRRLGFETGYIGYGLAGLLGGSILSGLFMGITGLAGKVKSITTAAAAGSAALVYLLASTILIREPGKFNFLIPFALLICSGALMGWIHLVTIHQVYIKGPRGSAASRQGFLEAAATAVLPLSYILTGIVASKIPLDTPWILRAAGVIALIIALSEAIRKKPK